MKKIRLTVFRPTLLTTIKVALVGFWGSWALFMTVAAIFIGIFHPEGFFPGSTKLEAIGGIVGLWIFGPITAIVFGSLPLYIAFLISQKFVHLKLEFYTPDDSNPEVVEHLIDKTDRGVL